MTVFPESLGKWIIVDLQLGDPLILVGGDTEELGLLEGGGGVEVVGHHVLQREHVRGRNHVQTHVIFMHRGQDNLKFDILLKYKILKRITYMAILVHIVIGQLDFMEGDIVFHPVTSGGWAVWVEI